MARPNASGSLSPFMYLTLNEMYKNAIEYYSKSDNKIFQYEINFWTHHALAVFPLAVAVWEAYLNEQIMGKLTWPEHRGNVLATNRELQDLVERSDIKKKSILLPQLFYGETFEKGEQPYQDFTKLVDIRNSIVHYKPYDYPKNAVIYLEKKQITLFSPKNSILSWPMALESSECIRWAINTVCSMILKLNTFKEYKDSTEELFKPISKTQVIQLFQKFNVDYSFVSKDYTKES